MKKNLLLSILLVGFIALAATPTQDTTVYICKDSGPVSKRYHLDPNCQGLNGCTTAIDSIALEEAQEMSGTLCGWED